MTGLPGALTRARGHRHGTLPRALNRCCRSSCNHELIGMRDTHGSSSVGRPGTGRSVPILAGEPGRISISGDGRGWASASR